MVTADRKTNGRLITQWRLAGALHPRECAHQSLLSDGGWGVHENRGGNREIGGITRDFCAYSHAIPSVTR